MDAFYNEALGLLRRTLGSAYTSLNHVLEDAKNLNRSLLKRPFQTTNIDVGTGFNVWEFYRGIVRGEEVPMLEKPVTYHIDRTSQAYWSWDEFCREVIWYGNKKGAYLYANRQVEPQIAGIY